MRTVILVIIFGLMWAAVWLVWHLLARPYAVAAGLIPLTAYDWVVRGWKAERRGMWGIALDNYEKALDLSPGDQEALIRRDALLAARPELIDHCE